jgi:hypothetical protein
VAETLAKHTRPGRDAAALLKLAQAGDNAALAELRQVFDTKPELWATIGDLGKQAELSWIGVASGGDALISEALSRRIADLRQELAGPASTVLERLLIDRILVTWIQVHHLDRMSAGESLTCHQREYMQRSLDRAQRRYISAIRSLATVRRLLLPTLQVNIAREQVNVANA